MIKLCIVTATRAEYGLLKPLIKGFLKKDEVDLKIVATGAHLSPEFGETYLEIEADGYVIDKKIDMLLSSDLPSGISKSMGLALIGFADYFKDSKPDVIILLGDRYESLSVAIAAMNEQIPIVHLYGGETTEGAIDEGIRHAITKLSLLHFTSTTVYRKRVIQLGESPDRVFDVGALGIENILSEELLSRSELEESIGFSLDKPFGVVTFHPVTLEANTSKKQMTELLKSIDTLSEMKFIFTKANADAHGRVINEMIDEYCKDNDNAIAFVSLGLKRYLSALKYCELVIGNSSSGIIEAPSFGIPTINIGDRQKGRLQADSVVNCLPLSEEIVQTVQYSRKDAFKKICTNCVNPYGEGATSSKIIDTVITYFNKEKKEIKKQFYDIE